MGQKKFVVAKVSEPTNEFRGRIHRSRKPLRLVALRFPEKNPNGLAELKHACSRGSPLVIFPRKSQGNEPPILRTLEYFSEFHRLLWRLLINGNWTFRFTEWSKYELVRDRPTCGQLCEIIGRTVQHSLRGEGASGLG